MKGQVILKNLQWLGRHNPAFTPGSVQTAVAELLNPTSSILPYSGRLCLDKPAIVCTGTIFFNIDAGATKDVNFQILMPTAEGTYPVHLDIFSNDQLLEAYQAAEEVVIGVAPVIKIMVTRAYLREDSPKVSEAYSGWLSITPGSELNLGLFGRVIQAGALIVNQSSIPVTLDFEAWNHHWLPEEERTNGSYTDAPLVLPQFEPQRFPPAPTGLAYSSYQYEADKFCPPGTTLNPGQTGFVYTALYSQGRRWNYINLKIYANGQEVGTVRLYWGWYSY
ncbi:hypothetical protein ES707_02978 [subsurface metagenome]